ncbi:MAG: hypothetical protein PHD87_02200 [Candidatus Cloacimonetes bacterium]|nr:hypothetical protein [Candidatus Cloacimonadota bacterium]
MKKTFLISLLILLGSAVCLAQVEGAETIEPVPAEEEVIEGRDLQIQIKTMMPDISVVQIKTDTYAPAARYDFTISLAAIQSASNKQLTNWKQEILQWLEESK